MATKLKNKKVVVRTLYEENIRGEGRIRAKAGNVELISKTWEQQNTVAEHADTARKLFERFERFGRFTGVQEGLVSYTFTMID